MTSPGTGRPRVPPIGVFSSEVPLSFLSRAGGWVNPTERDSGVTVAGRFFLTRRTFLGGGRGP